MNLEKQKQRKKQMRDIFLTTVLQIIQDEGMDKVTVRKVAGMAGYNIATLYNYFENLDHLLFFAAMSYLNDYTKTLQKKLAKIRDSREFYRKSWLYFAQHSFDHAQIYYILFFARLSNRLASYMEDFCELYPHSENLRRDGDKKDFYQSEFRKRSMLMMKWCEEEGYFPPNQGKVIDDIVLYTYQALLYQIYEKNLSKEEGYQKFQAIVDYFFDVDSPSVE